MRPVLILLPFALGCTEYSITSAKDPERPGRDTSDPIEDSAPPDSAVDTVDQPACFSQIIDEHSVPLVDACRESASPVGSFTPVVEWEKRSWSIVPGSTDIMMMPAVGSFSDDDGDGDADQDDIPDVVVITYGSQDMVRVVSGDGSGTELLNLSGTGVQGQGGVAIGDINNDGWQDIVFPTNAHTLVAVDHNGTRLWTSPNLGSAMYGTSDNPAIADLNSDGQPEIICGSAIVSNTGAVLGIGNRGIGGVNGYNVGTTSFAYDINGDGVQEVVVGNALYKRDGSTIWYNGQLDGYPAVGNFDADDAAEIVVSVGGTIRLQDDNGAVLCSVAIPGAGSSYYGGPPTIADFDGDGEAEFAAAAGSRYTVFEKDCTIKWQHPTTDASSGNTGSAVFDFEGDGVAEAVYADETRLWVFAGPDGATKLESTHHSNATWLEYPSIADVDGDGQAEIIVANTLYTASYTGFTVFGDADNSWRPGRKIWNQHAYSITNINDDGSIPAVPVRNLTVYNNFRSGALDVGADLPPRPDLVATIEDLCVDDCDKDRLVAWVSVANQGYSDVDADVVLELIGADTSGTTRVLASTTVTDRIPAGQALQAFELVLDSGVADISSLVATIDGGNAGTGALVEECDEANNESTWAAAVCATP